MLDIIIPTYKNKEGLRKTLQSINKKLLSEITITVIDDCSDMYYNDILEEFPFFTILYNKTNIGPGMTRQHGIDMTSEPYIIFIDTDDYFLSDDVQEMVLNTIKTNPEPVIFSWQYKTNERVSEDSNNRLHGRVYKREFLNKYGICFCPESSSFNEDIGFNRLCRIVVESENLKVMPFKEPIIEYTFNPNSLTHINNNAYFYNQQNYGLARNIIHEVKIARAHHISKIVLLKEINNIMGGLYYAFLCTIHERPEFAQNAWGGARLFYNEIFKDTPNPANEILKGYNAFIKAITIRKQKVWKKNYPLNYTKFLRDLKKYKNIPEWYCNQ